MIKSNLKLCTFGVCWLQPEVANKHSKQQRDEPILVLPGVGGRNGNDEEVFGVLLAKLINSSKLQDHKYFQTDTISSESTVGRSVCSGTILSTSVICICIGRKCILCLPTKSSNGYSVVLEFDGDFGDTPQSSLNCCCISRNGRIITGGDDGVCRIWEVSRATGGWSVLLFAELRGHIDSIISVDKSATDDWILTCSKDGYVRVWDENSRAVIGESLSVRLAAEGDESTESDRFVSCCFSADGGFVYSIQFDASSVNSFLVKWTLSTIGSDEENSESLSDSKILYRNNHPSMLLEFLPLSVTMIKNHQSTHVQASDSGELVAVGCSDGSVHVYGTSSVTLQGSFQPFDKPILGMSFKLASNLNYELLGCCSDSNVAVLKVGGPSIIYYCIFFLLCLIFLFASIMLYTLIVHEDLSLQYISKFLEYGREMHFEL